MILKKWTSKIRVVLFSVFLIITPHLQAQTCILEALALDLKNASTEFTDFLNTNENGTKIWKTLFDAGETGLGNRIDALKFVDTYLTKNDKKIAELATEITNAGGYVKWKSGVKVGARFIAKSGTELKTFLNKLDDVPIGNTYTGSIYRSLSKDAEKSFGALHNKMTDHTVYSSWGRYDLDKAENAMYLSKKVSGNKTEITHYGKWEDYNTYEFKNVKVDNLLDLSDDAVRQKLGTQFDDLVETVGERKDIYEMTNVLASWARKKGYNGIIAPGARGTKNYENIILFNQSYIDDVLKGVKPQKIIK